MRIKQKRKVKNISRFLLSGSIMTLCSIILRTVSLGFNVYVANTAGPEAVGLYSMLGTVYGFCVTLALSGINLALTRLLAESIAIGNTQRGEKLIKSAIVLALGFGFFSSLMLLTVAKPVSVIWLKEPRAVRPMTILAFSLPAVALSSVFNGYFTACRRAYKNSFSQLAEMCQRIGFTILFFGIISMHDPESACIALALGSALAEIGIFAVNLAVYFFDRTLHFKPSSKKLGIKETTSDLLSVSLPVAFTSYVRSGLLSVEHSLIPKGLFKYGASASSALSSYGTLSGMAMPLINFPYALIGSFTALLIPEVAQSRARCQKKHIRYIIFRTYQCCIIFACGVFGVFFAFSEPFGMLLYDSPEACRYIKLLSFLVPIMYTDTATDAVLKGLGEQLYCMKVNIADALISVCLVALLVPRYGIIGYVATLFSAEMINILLSASKLIRVSEFKFPFARLLAFPIFCITGAFAIYNIFSRLLPSIETVFSLVLRILIFVLIYFILIRMTSVLSSEDSRWLYYIIKQKDPQES